MKKKGVDFQPGSVIDIRNGCNASHFMLFWAGYFSPKNTAIEALEKLLLHNLPRMQGDNTVSTNWLNVFLFCVLLAFLSILKKKNILFVYQFVYYIINITNTFAI